MSDAAQALDDALRPFDDGKPDAAPTIYSQRMTAVMDTVIALLGERYTWGNAWDNFPLSCRVMFNVRYQEPDGKVTAALFAETHRNLKLWREEALVQAWMNALRASFEEPPAPVVYKSDDNGCI